MASCCPVYGAISQKDLAVNNFAAKAGTVCNLCVSNLRVTNTFELPICANYPLVINNNCVDVVPGFCGSIMQYVNGAWGIYRSPGLTEITVGDPGDGSAPGANFLTVAAALGDALNTNCRFIRVTSNVTEVAPLSLPGDVLIYVDSGITWTLNNSIAGNGNNLIFRGSGLASRISVNGAITGVGGMSIFDVSAQLEQGVQGSGEFYIRDSNVTVSTNNNLATGFSELTIDPTKLLLTNGAGIATNVPVVKMTDVQISGSGFPAVLLDGYSWADINHLRFLGSTATALVLRQARFVEIYDDANGLLSINIAQQSAPLLPPREVSGFYGGRFIQSNNPNSDIMDNVILRGIQVQRFNFSSLGDTSATLWQNSIWSDIEMTDTAAFSVECSYQDVQVTNLKTQPLTTLRVVAQGVFPAPFICREIEWQNIVTGVVAVESLPSLPSSVTDWTIDGLRCERFFNNAANLEAVTLNNAFFEDTVVNNVFSTTSSPSLCALNNIVCRGNMVINSAGRSGLTVNNLTVLDFHILQVGGQDILFSNIQCGILDVTQSAELCFSNLRVQTNNTTTLGTNNVYQGHRFLNATFGGPLTVNTNSNYFQQLVTAELGTGGGGGGTADLFISGNSNTITGFSSEAQNILPSISGSTAKALSIRVNGNWNKVSHVLLAGSSGAAENFFRVFGAHNEFTNITLGDASDPTDAGAFGSLPNSGSGSEVYLGGLNNLYANFFVIPRQNSVAPGAPPTASQNLIILDGTFNHYSNCVFYRDGTNFPTLIGATVFANQSVDATGANDCVFSNCRVGPNVFPSGVVVGSTFNNAVGSRNLYVGTRTGTNAIVNPGAGSVANITY